MKRNILIFTLLFLLFSSALAQTEKDSIINKTNPILFADISLGYANGALKGVMTGASINYEKNKNLFTFRITSVIDLRKVKFFLFFPVFGTIKSIDEFSFLYGRRFVNDDFSYHFSVGISHNTYKLKIDSEETIDYFVGFPLEIGFSWFKPKKEKFRVLYGLIPVGKPTSFGRSFGVKLYANVAEKTYIGIGLNFGIGWHKKY
ncbi:hypothetical protein [Polaribacter sargassicola]|uniref:hypothetical protein n=1 Tax=Polaribacter sargassicola TaxID=2836891 RepID=UPI001F2D47A3|nr:hypothetical protein [Polaribacter sp. DS7-9]MCG1035166.1 hypothetical protein [Polaribacter sp. DS7-9]